MPAENDISTWTFEFRNATFDVVRRDPAAHVAMRTESDAATDPSRAPPVPGSHTDLGGSVWQRLTLEREALQEWPVGEGRWVCAAPGQRVRDGVAVHALGQASVDVGPHDELRLSSPEPGDLRRNAGEHATPDSPPPSLGRDSTPASEGYPQFAHPEDCAAIEDAVLSPKIDAEKDCLDFPEHSNTPAATCGNEDVPAPSRRGFKRRHDECEADSGGRSSGGKRLRRDASMLLTGAALTYAALAYL